MLRSLRNNYSLDIIFDASICYVLMIYFKATQSEEISRIVSLSSAKAG